MNRKTKEKLKNKLKFAFDIPEPIQKDNFLSTLPYKKPTNLNFAFSQLGYIRKRFWILSILLLVLLNIFYLNLQQGKEAVGFLSAIIPFLTLFSFSEIYKSRSHNMCELEASCKYDLGRLTLIRLCIIGAFQFALILGLLIIFKNKTQFGNLRFIIYTITPFLLSTYLSFSIVNHYKSQESLYICSGVTLVISSLVFLSNFNSKIYSNSYLVTWYGVFFMALLLLVKEIYKLLNRRGELWSLI